MQRLTLPINLGLLLRDVVTEAPTQQAEELSRRTSSVGYTLSSGGMYQRVSARPSGYEGKWSSGRPAFAVW